MNAQQENLLTESTKLLRRLKIVHSFSANQFSNGNEAKSNISSHSAKNVVQSQKNNQYAAHRVPLPIVSKNKNDSALVMNKKIVTENNKNNDIIRRNIESINKIGKRSFSTLGRFLSTPSGTKDEEFLVEVAQGILTKKIKRIVIMAGAGISCPSGIPDFRTPGSGLYDNLRQYNIPFPEAIFDIDYFMTNPKPFFTLAKDLFPSGKYRPNRVHYFFKLLQEKNLLQRVYTQNIDGLERLAGVTHSHLVEAHGTFASATCIKCGEIYSGDYVKINMDKHNISRCSKCQGIVKPDIVFFGEDLPPKFQLHSSDFRQADLLLVMGTSLEVEPFASIVDSTRFGVPRILLNKQVVGVFRSKKRLNDNCLIGDIVESIGKIVKALGWEEDLEKMIESGEDNRISFLDTICHLKEASNIRCGYSQVRRSRPSLLPPVSRRFDRRKNVTCDVSSTDSCDSSSGSDTSSS